MDFGVLGLDALVGTEPDTTATAKATVFASSYPEAKHKWYGSGNLKQERSCIAEVNDGKCSKILKINDNNNNIYISASKGMFSTSLFSEGQQQPAEQMLSFTCPKSQNVTWQYSSSAHNKNTGFNLGGLNGANMHGAVTETRGPFTPSQWMELEHQALIYKYILANVPVPSNLLVPIRKALESAGFSCFPGGILRPTLGWGSFHMGFSNNSDPEPGRCRRTDGKKWRCSRDAVTDQKYCERHMNRGRHRSRKPVEGQNGHSAPGTSTSSSKLMPTASSASVVASGGASNLTSANNLQTGASNLSAASSMNRMFLSNENVGDRMPDSGGLSLLSSSAELKYEVNPFLIGKQQTACGESSAAAFGLVSSDSLVNPSHKGTSLLNCRDFASQNPTTGEAGLHPLRHFIDKWPKNQCDRVAVSWPQLNIQQNRTQLSMSISMGSADFMSSTSSPTNVKVSLLPLRSSRESDPVQMGLGVSSEVNEADQRQANCLPVSWEHSVGGPLGEVLHSTNNNGSDCKNSPSSLNLMTGRWDNSHGMGSSPTGVLHKSTFASLSNSSVGSSPRQETNKTHEGASHCKDILNSTPGSSSPMPTL